ncbi:MAG: DNA-3-methyladenine glycosylase 2 family protein [Bacteroidetes bacterium]|nr:DNA-3-methyladenine glycosylase 2 family protein [Bacteroidota bacterium]
MNIQLPENFSYDLCLSFLKRSPREVLHRIEDETVTKALSINEQLVIFQIKNADKYLNVDFLNLSGAASVAIENYTRAYIREWFDLETDLKPFYSLGLKDELLKDLVKKYKGYRIIGQPDLFESLVWAVLGQQINLQFAYTLKQRFVEQFGERVNHNGIDYFLFPQPKIVSQLTDTDLLPLQFSRQKSKYVKLIGEAFANNAVSKEALSKLSFDEAKMELMKIKGIGNWTANYALMKTFRYPNAFPLEDAGLHNAIKNLKRMKKKPSPEQVKRIFKKYKGWEAYATLYLWKSL